MASKKKQKAKKKAQHEQTEMGAIRDEDLEQVSGGSAMPPGVFPFSSPTEGLEDQAQAEPPPLEAQTLLKTVTSPPSGPPIPSG